MDEGVAVRFCFLLFLSHVAMAQELHIAKPDPKIEALRQELFKADNNVPCKILSKTPQGSVAALPSLEPLLRDFLAAVKTADSKTLAATFHERMKVSPSKAESAWQDMKRITGDKYEASYLRVYALNAKSRKEVACPEDNIDLFPTYGYDAQAAAWLQIQGAKDMARIYLSLVPRTDGKDLRWSVGAFHVQQWTHAGRDGNDWLEEGKKLHAEQKPLAAWFMLDLAAKLYDGGGFVSFPAKTQIESLQQSWFAKEAWLDRLRNLLPDQKVVYAASLFIRDGAALLIRFETTAEISLKDMQSRCLQVATKLKPHFPGVLGVRCGYNFPKEDVEKEGVLGSVLHRF
jgi:hypothetical protein